MYRKENNTLQRKQKQQDNNALNTGKAIIFKNKVGLIFFGIIGGILLKDYLNYLLIVSLFVCAFALLKKKYFYIVVLLLSCLSAFNASMFYVKSPDYELASVNARVVDVLSQDSYLLDNVKVNGEALDKDAIMYYSDDTLDRGAVVNLQGSVNSPYESSNIGQANFEQIYLSQNIEKFIYANELTVVESAPSIITRLNSLKDLIPNRIGKDKGGLINGIIFGDKTYIDDNLLNTFSAAGISHILAVSGLHVGAVLFVLIFLLKKFKYRLYIILPILLFIVAVTGFSPSVIRAALMATLYLISLSFGQKYNLLISAFIAGSILLLLNPYNIYSSGFLLSFACVFGIGLFYEPIYNKLIKVKSPKILSASIAMYFATQIVALPITIYIFNEVSLLGLLGNVLIVPFVIIILIVGILGLVLYPIQPLSYGLLSVAGFGMEGVSYIAKWIENFGLTLSLATPQFILLIFFYAVVMILCMFYFKKKYIAYSVMGILFAMMFVNFNSLSKTPYIYMADVGDAMALHIRTENNEHIIIDGGRRGTELETYLKSIGARDITVFCTHEDSDHYGGLGLINEEFNIINFYTPILTGSESYNELMEAVDNKTQVKAGDSFNIDGAIIEVVYPNQGIEGGSNANSLNMYITVNGRKILITGDIDKEDEIKYQQVDILQIPHHGSENNTSLDMLRDANATYALISGDRLITGYFPNQRVLSTKEYGGVKIELDQELTVYGVKTE